MPSDKSTVCKALTVNHIAISVRDLERSKQWYCRMFGLSVIQESPQSVLLGFGDSMLVLRTGPEPGTISHFMFGIDAFDAANLEAALTAQGLDPQKDSDSFQRARPRRSQRPGGRQEPRPVAGIIENGLRMK